MKFRIVILFSLFTLILRGQGISVGSNAVGVQSGTAVNQQLSKNGTILTLENGGSVDLSDIVGGVNFDDTVVENFLLMGSTVENEISKVPIVYYDVNTTSLVVAGGLNAYTLNGVIPFDNSGTPLSSTNIENAIRELAGISGALTSDQLNIINNRLKSPKVNIVGSDGSFTLSNIRVLTGVDVSRPVNNVVNNGDIVSTLDDLGETSGDLNGEVIYAKVEGSLATWTIDVDNLYQDGFLVDNKKVLLGAGDGVIFENNTLGGWDIFGSYTLLDGFAENPYADNTNPNLVGGALAFNTSDAMYSPSNTFNTSNATVVAVNEHPYENTHAIRITSTVDGSYTARAVYDFVVDSNTLYNVAISRRAFEDARYRFSIGTVVDHDTNFSNTTDFVVDEFQIETTGTSVRLDLYADYGSSKIGNYAEYFVILKKAD